jgi:hypothetical protein
MPHLALGRFGSVLDLGQQLGLDPERLVCDRFAVGLGLADQRPRCRAVLGEVSLTAVGQVVAPGGLDALQRPAMPLVMVRRLIGLGLLAALVFAWAADVQQFGASRECRGAFS